MRMIIPAAFLLLTACGQDDVTSLSGEETLCGRRAVPAIGGGCECRRGYEWCNLDDETDTNCCAVEPSCGNGLCDGGESNSTCAEDCPSGVRCGDGTCSPSEASTTCPADCGAPSQCGDGVCDADENARACPGDCAEVPANDCGNGRCESGETAATCPADCGSADNAVCGNGRCEAGETTQSCPADCQVDESPVCGDGRCEGTETSATCPVDCGLAECGTAACVEDRCFDACETYLGCGLVDADDCLDSCTGTDRYYDDWLDPRYKRSDCYAALGALWTCESNSSCAELETGNSCLREFGRYETECPEVPLVVNITFLSVLMGPQSPAGCEWDGPTCNPLPRDLLNRFGELIVQAVAAKLGVAPIFIPEVLQEAVGELLGAALSGLLSQFSPPDIFGTVTVYEADLAPRSGTFDVTNDSYQASMGPMTFPTVLLAPSTYASLDLYDSDLSFNDAVGPVFLDRDQFLTAWMTGGNAWVLVAERPEDPVLQVQLRVEAVE